MKIDAETEVRTYHEVFLRSVEINGVHDAVHLLRRLVYRTERLPRERAEERRLPGPGCTTHVA